MAERHKSPEELIPLPDDIDTLSLPDCVALACAVRDFDAQASDPTHRIGLDTPELMASPLYRNLVDRVRLLRDPDAPKLERVHARLREALRNDGLLT